MITPTLIYRYSIELYVSTECSLADLFSGSWKDGSLFVEERAFDEGAKWWDATYAIRPNGMVIAQLIIFRTKNGYDKYKYDGVTLFDDPYN